ncbi:hypothetical protein [Mycolicibacterium sp. XJ1819]
MTRRAKGKQEPEKADIAKVLSEMAIDQRDDYSPDDAAEHDRWLRENVPPHHS